MGGSVWITSLRRKKPSDKVVQQFAPIWSKGRGKGIRWGKEYEDKRGDSLFPHLLSVGPELRPKHPAWPLAAFPQLLVQWLTVTCCLAFKEIAFVSFFKSMSFILEGQYWPNKNSKYCSVAARPCDSSCCLVYLNYHTIVIKIWFSRHCINNKSGGISPKSSFRKKPTDLSFYENICDKYSGAPCSLVWQDLSTLVRLQTPKNQGLEPANGPSLLSIILSSEEEL